VTRPRPLRRLWLLFALWLLFLLPSAGVVGRALADEEPEPGPADPGARGAISQKRRAVLAAIPRDHGVLVNVTRADLPASPDILNLGKRAAGALARCVSDNVDDGVRSLCAALLGQLGDKRALVALQGALEAWNPEVRGAAIAALRRMPDASSFGALESLLLREDETPDNRLAALSTLGLLSDQRAVRLLRKKLHEQAGSDLRPAAFRGLWTSRHLCARATLVGDVEYALKSGDPGLVLPATYAAAELRDPRLVSALVPLMGNPDSRVRNRAVYALGKIGDRAATRALLAHIPEVREARMLNNIAFALERLDPKAFYQAVQSLIQHRQAAIRMNAAFVLGDVRRSEGVPLLAKALDDQNDYVRVSALAALGKLEAPEAIRLVERFLGDKNRTLSQTAHLSLLALSNGQQKDLVYRALVARSEGDAAARSARLEAALALARFGDSRVVGEVLGCLEQGTCSLDETEPLLTRQKASSVGGRLLLAWSKGRSDLTDLVGRLRPEGTGVIALSEVQASLAAGHSDRARQAMDLVGDVGEKEAMNLFSSVLDHPNTQLRMHAAVALARLGHTKADQLLFAELDNLPQDRLAGMARLLGRVREPGVKARWQPELVGRERGSDPALGLAAAAVRFAWDADSAFFRWLDALASPRVDERELATRYLARDRRPVVTALLRRALAREGRPFVRDLLRKLLDVRSGSVGAAS
jgi:HEAT repeat protein